MDITHVFELQLSPGVVTEKKYYHSPVSKMYGVQQKLPGKKYGWHGIDPYHCGQIDRKDLSTYSKDGFFLKNNNL